MSQLARNRIGSLARPIVPALAAFLVASLGAATSSHAQAVGEYGILIAPMTATGPLDLVTDGEVDEPTRDQVGFAFEQISSSRSAIVYENTGPLSVITARVLPGSWLALSDAATSAAPDALIEIVVPGFCGEADLVLRSEAVWAPGAALIGLVLAVFEGTPSTLDGWELVFGAPEETICKPRIGILLPALGQAKTTK